MAKKTIINTEFTNVIQLVSDKELETTLGEAFSSVLINPAVAWGKFILTDDNSNSNNQRIPLSEFDNLITSGIFMPVKMAEGEIKDGHEDAKPLGVITHLKRVQAESVGGKIANQIIAIAAFWLKERPADIQYIKDKAQSGDPLNVSWEILYSDYSLKDDGVVDLLGTTLKAVTIVGKPAYAGRTPILAVSAKKWSRPYIEGLPDSSFLLVETRRQPDGSEKRFRYFAYRDGNGNVDPSRFAAIQQEVSGSSLPANVLKKVRAQLNKLVSQAEAGVSLDELNSMDIQPVTFTLTEEDKLDELEKLTKENGELRAALSEKDGKIAELEGKLSELRGALEAHKAESASAMSELEELREYKKAVEASELAEQRLVAIKEKFAKAGLEKDDDYFSANRDMLMSLDDAALDFLVQELVAFAESNAGKESNSSTKIPNLQNDSSKVGINDLAKALRERRQ